MSKGNRGFADLLAKSHAPAGVAARLPPRTGILDERQNRLAALAAGATLARVQEWVDPARCRIWEGHNRDYAALNAENCADLIESIRAQGRQEVAAIVRRITGDPAHEFEVVCGARRHWTVAWLRANNFPEFRFLIEPRELSDEEAFRLADLENRNRRDLSDYERACDYARAVARYYGGSQQRMAERLEVGKSWLSRYLELARMPREVLDAFGSPHAVGISHAAALAPLLRAPAKRERLLAAAATLAAEQAHLAGRGAPALKPAAVLRRLVAAAEARRAAPPRHTEHVVRGADRTIVARGQRVARGGALAITIPAPEQHPRSDLLAAVAEILDRMATKPGAPGR
jgi:ParB family chromosome partitioning protein